MGFHVSLWQEVSTLLGVLGCCATCTECFWISTGVRFSCGINVRYTSTTGISGPDFERVFFRIMRSVGGCWRFFPIPGLGFVEPGFRIQALRLGWGFQE